MSELIQLPFLAGIDEGTDPKQLPPGTLKVGENVRQDKAKRIRKRLGMENLSQLDTDSGNFVAQRLLGMGSAVCATDAKDYAFPYGNSDAWMRIDRTPNLASTVYPLADTTRTTTQATVTVVGTKRVSVYGTGLTGFGTPANAPIYVQVEDVATGAILLPPTLVNTSASRPLALNNGSDEAYVVYLTAAGDVKSTPLDLDTFALGSPVTLAAGASIYDAVLSGAVLFITYVTGAGGIFIDRGSITTGVMTHSVNPAAAATYTACALDASGGNYVRLVYSTTAPTTRVVTRLALNLNAVVGPTVISATEAHALAVLGTGAGLSGSMIVARTVIDGTYFCLSTHSVVVNDTSHAIGTLAGIELSHHVIVSSRLFEIGARYYFLATTAVIPPTIATTNATYVSPQSAIVLEANPLISNVPTASALPHRRVATLESRTSALQLYATTQTPADSDGRVHIAVARKQREPVGTEGLPLGAVTHRIEERGEDWGRSLAIGNSTLGVASAPFFIDGPTCHPYGFAHEPDIIQSTAGGGGSGSMGAGTYLYACVFEWRDARGVLHRSAPSAIVTVTGVPATGSVALRIACTTVDAKQSVKTLLGSSSASPVRIAIYRSTAGGSVLYRLTHEPTYNVLFNDPTAFSVTHTDTRADTSITATTPTIRLDSRPQLYTGGELEEVNPSAATTGTVHRNRAWLLSADRRTLQASKKFDEDTELAPGFNEALTLLFATPKYALASLDDKLVALGEDGIEVVYGDGPTSNGDASDWQIQRVHSDAGCVNPKSVAVIPPGIVYLSPRGFELLDRGLSLTYLGAPVEDTLATYPVVTSAVLVPEEQEVRFTCTNEDGDAGVVLALSYSYRAWYTRKYRNPDTPDFDLPIIDARLVDGVYTILGADGIVRQETPGACLDDGSYVTMRVAVPVYPNGPAGWHRLRSVQVLGESASHHKLTITAARDFTEAAEQTETFEDGSTVTDIGPLEQARMTLKHQKRQAAVITIYDEAPDNEAIGTGEGPILEMLALYVEPKQGPAKLAAAKKG